MGKILAFVLVAAFTFGGLAVAAEVEGTIQTIDAMSKVVVLDNGSSLVVIDDTKIMQEGKEAKLEDLKQGGKVKASYDEKDGKNVAATIEVAQ